MTSPVGRWRLRRAVVGVVFVVGLGIGLSACGNAGTSLARQACTYVNRSIALLKEAQHQRTSSEYMMFQQQAYNELRRALPIAAEAAYRDGQWQALMTTVSESNGVPETTLVSALTAQCGQADRSTFDQPPPPSSIPPPAPPSS